MSDSKKKDFRTSIGGQALIEGILMRGPKSQAIAIRKPDGEIDIKESELKLVKDKHPWLGIPFIRGPVNFIDSMVKGMQAVTYSAEFLPEEEQEAPSKLDVWIEEKLGSEKGMKVIIGIAVVLGILLSVGLFMLLPTVLAGGLVTFLEFMARVTETALPAQIAQSFVFRNITEGVIRVVIFLIYLWLVTKMDDVERMFAYHGAEHKSIFCYERGLDLTVENVREMPRQHPRCGTSFLFVVMIVSILVFSVVRWSNTWVRMGFRLLLLPVVVSISYEINRLVGRYDNRLTRILAAPGKALQKLTTNEPDDSMIEIAIAALERVIPEEKGADSW